MISSGLIDVVGCDIGRAEGITGALRVIALVEQADVWFNSHAWSSAVNTAASIALSATTPRCLLQELKPDENPMQHELVDEPFAQKDGWIEVPRKPGLGVEPRESVLDRYRLVMTLTERMVGAALEAYDPLEARRAGARAVRLPGQPDCRPTVRPTRSATPARPSAIATTCTGPR